MLQPAIQFKNRCCRKLINNVYLERILIPMMITYDDNDDDDTYHVSFYFQLLLVLAMNEWNIKPIGGFFGGNAFMANSFKTKLFIVLKQSITICYSKYSNFRLKKNVNDFLCYRQSPGEILFKHPMVLCSHISNIEKIYRLIGEMYCLIFHKYVYVGEQYISYCSPIYHYKV